MWRIVHHDILRGLDEIPDNYFDTAITSPMYFNQRVYPDVGPTLMGGDPTCPHIWNTKEIPALTGGTNQDEKLENSTGMTNRPRPPVTESVCRLCGAWKGLLGLESTPELYIDHQGTIFDLVKQKLRPDGTLWVVIGDSYAGSGNGWQKRSNDESWHRAWLDEWALKRPPAYISSRQENGAKPKDLYGIPWMFAFELRRRGWWLRRDIIWHKPNAKRESVKDRPTTEHEYVFLFSKSERYRYNIDATRIPHKTPADKRERRVLHHNRDTGYGDATYLPGKGGNGERTDHGYHPLGKNRGSVWSVPIVAGHKGHHAGFPPALIEPMIWASCSCTGAILDPFCGTATVGMLALQEGLEFWGIDASASYCEIAAERLSAIEG